MFFEKVFVVYDLYTKVNKYMHEWSREELQYLFY